MMFEVCRLCGELLDVDEAERGETCAACDAFDADEIDETGDYK